MAIAVTFPTTSVKDTSNIEVYTTGAFIPTASSILIVFAYVRASVNEIALTDSSGAIEWNCLSRIVSGLGGDTMGLWWGLVPASPSSITISADVTGDAGTGGLIHVSQWTGLNTASPIRQVADKRATTGADPSITFNYNTSTTNAYAIVLANDRNPFAATQPTSWTEDEDNGFNSPTTGIYFCHRINGEAGSQTISCTALSSSYRGYGFEVLDSSLPIIVHQLGGSGVGS